MSNKMSATIKQYMNFLHFSKILRFHNVVKGQKVTSNLLNFCKSGDKLLYRCSALAQSCRHNSAFLY